MEFNREEIIKALEEHYKQVDKGYSTHLEYGGKGDEHEEKYIYMLRDILGLINHLQVENELLQAKCEGVQEANAILREYNETAKAEAYKEFAYDLKQIPSSIIHKNEIDIVLKEKLRAI